MLDIKLIRENPDMIKKAMKNRNVDPGLVDMILEKDETYYRVPLKQLEDRRAAHKSDKKPVSQIEVEELRKEKEEIKSLEEAVRVGEEAVHSVLNSLPNIPLEDTPIGASAADNVVVSEFGEKPKFSFTPKHYLDLNEKIAGIYTDRASEVSGSRFAYLVGPIAMLEFALLQYALSKLTDKDFISDLIKQHNLPISAKPFIPTIPPVLIRPEMMRAMGFMERAGVDPGSEEIYYLPKDDLYLIGTSEQSVGPFYYDTILSEEQLPKRHVAFSTCFRRESGAAGKDTRGILRVHQFDKLEMFVVATPEGASHEHRLLLACEEALMQELGLHYRVVRLCTGDIGQAAASTYDIETWMPGQDEYRETHSTSNTTDYQSRALKTRFRDADNKMKLVHMLNGTVFSMNRPIIAILEQFQNEDGSVTVPEVLRPYMGGLDIIR
jgi:seryl-tRNA synthetase